MIARHRHIAAFTLLEVLVAVSIIAILITLVTLGVGHITKTGREKSTRVAMDNLKNMITEREVTGGLAAVNDIHQPPPKGNLQPPGVPNRESAPGNVTEGGADRKPTWQAGTPALPQNVLARTQAVMGMLKAVPNNAKFMAAIPSEQLWNPGVAGSTAPVALDAWKNPIIYVPAGGLAGVYVTGEDPASPGGKIRPILITAPGNRPFWASAGADGTFGFLPGANGAIDAPPGSIDDIAGGDDNVYSFEN